MVLTFPPIFYILRLDIYKTAFLNARAKNSAVSYADMKRGIWTLAYNPATKDAYFIKRFDLPRIQADYLEAFPLRGELPITSRRKLMADLRDNGWPEILGV